MPSRLATISSMADQPPRRSTQQRGRAQPPAPGQQGWRVTPAPDGRGASQTPRPPSPSRSRWWIAGAIVLFLLAINLWVSSQALKPNPPIRIPYSPTFLNEVQANNVSSISSTGDAITGTLKKPISYPQGGKSSTNVSTQIPSFADNATLFSSLRSEGVTINAQPTDKGPSVAESLIFGFGPTLLLVALFVFIARRSAGAGGGAGGLMSFGRSRARRVEASDQHITFEDVAGIDEAKEELTEIVDFLKTPDKYLALGARIPRGVLLSGPPGTGKTLLARAVAGEAGVPFFQMSASEFVEMIVGVGASRVRDLFHQAKEAAPAIIFIDELDAIGRSRSSGGNLSGGHDEREQTLNQILTEMDGFSPRESVIVLGATNRPEILDQALLRPGRFDRRVVVVPPDRAGREAILEVHTRSVPLDTDVDLGGIAASTPGMVGADLANVANEAALLAAKRNHSKVARQDISDALERIVLGAARKVMLSEDDRRRTAYHEAGHAIMGMLTPGADPVRKVSIIPRGMALGVTFSAPDADRFNFDERHLLAQIKVALGGRVAEEVVFGDLTTGAESDIQQLTRIARGMVGRWGMSRAIGPVAVLPSDGQSPLLPGVSETSEQTQQLVDEEVRRIVETAHEETMVTLSAHRSNLDELVAALLDRETLDQVEAYRAAGLPQSAAAQLEAAPPVVQQ
jgi:cell division protease FtsH